MHIPSRPRSRRERAPDPEATARNLGLGVWSAGFAGLFGFILFSPVLSLVATLIVARFARRTAGRAAENARIALNWQWTYLLVHAALLGLHGAMLLFVTAGTTTGPASVTAGLLLVPAIVNVGAALFGAIRAFEGGVFRFPLAIPFRRSAVEGRDDQVDPI